MKMLELHGLKSDYPTAVNLMGILGLTLRYGSHDFWSITEDDTTRTRTLEQVLRDTLRRHNEQVEPVKATVT